MKKQCTRCKKIYLSLRNFNRDKQKKDGYTSNCRRCIRETGIRYNEKNREKNRDYAKKYYSQNKELDLERRRKRRTERVKKIFSILGEKCELCHEDNKIILQIDHKKGGGYKHRKISGGSIAYYNEILDNIKNFRLLCANCNLLEAVKNEHRKSIWFQ